MIPIPSRWALGGKDMGLLIWLAVILFILWILGFAVFKVTAFAIHLLLIVAVIALIVGLIRRV